MRPLSNSAEALKQLKTEPPYDPATPLRSTYLEKNTIPKDTRAAAFTAAPSARARRWRPAVHRERDGYGRRGTSPPWTDTQPLHMTTRCHLQRVGDPEALLPGDGRGETSYSIPRKWGLEKQWCTRAHSQNGNRLAGLENQLMGAGGGWREGRSALCTRCVSHIREQQGPTHSTQGSAQGHGAAWGGLGEKGRACVCARRVPSSST